MSKVKMMSPKDKKKGALVPRLRFPEFIGDREWDCAQMGDIYTFKKNNSFSRDMLNYNAGDVKNIHYGDIHKNFSSHFYAENENIPFINCNINLESMSEDCLCTAGDIIFADVSEDMKDIGKCIEIISNNKERILSGLHTIFTRQCSSTLVIGFGGHLFQSPRVRAQIQKEAQGTKILGISSGRLAKISISFPFAKGEQQKIADCLSSLDERIAAEANKLDTLKDHKKGLLKQLFPAEGETLPQLRFPEFRGAGEWQNFFLGEYSEVVRGGSPRPIDNFLTAERDGLNWLKIGDINKEAKYVVATTEKVRAEALNKTREIRPGDLILSNSMSFGRPYISKIKTCIHDGWIAITEISKKLHVDYIYYLISSPFSQHYFASNAAGSGVQNLNADIIKSLPIFFPNILEQQRIADCLSSLDEIITAQAQKIDLLKTHKKGLMQQLFPVIDEAKA